MNATPAADLPMTGWAAARRTLSGQAEEGPECFPHHQRSGG